MNENNAKQEVDTLTGKSLVELLGLKVKTNGRVDTSIGDKTMAGLALTVKSLLNQQTAMQSILSDDNFINESSEPADEIVFKDNLFMTPEDQIIFMRLYNATYKFAKTMRYNPHHYTLVYSWEKRAEFLEAVALIRRLGVNEPYKGKDYMVLNYMGSKFWSMDDNINDTVLINRKSLDGCVTENMWD